MTRIACFAWGISLLTAPLAACGGGDSVVLPGDTVDASDDAAPPLDAASEMPPMQDAGDARTPDAARDAPPPVDAGADVTVDAGMVAAPPV